MSLVRGRVRAALEEEGSLSRACILGRVDPGCTPGHGDWMGIFIPNLHVFVSSADPLELDYSCFQEH